MAMLMQCMREIEDKIDTYKGEQIEASFTVSTYQKIVRLVWKTNDRETTVILFDAMYHDAIDKATKVDLIKAFKEIGNAMIREHNAQVSLTKKPKGGIVEGPDGIDRRYK